MDRPLSTGEVAIGPHCIGGWVGPETSTDSTQKENLAPSENEPPSLNGPDRSKNTMLIKQSQLTFITLSRTIRIRLKLSAAGSTWAVRSVSTRKSRRQMMTGLIQLKDFQMCLTTV
jgi:hypothetical protein